MNFREFWVVECDGCFCALEAEDGEEILFQVRSRQSPSVFRTKAAAERAITRSMKYAEQHNYSWTAGRAIRFSRG
jgi:hypothetical protein